uniref:GST C-terminal domain-containing protein n=1 Tax=Percolomonas cosmopolitus TaxID=63605 RepID=A0A7S1PJ24_9EUKA|mmetsp:Transcript_5518/g.20732  ORF Transcript_5518/g.20732 Transcript_5518/m.20732 type:complete len:621 (+) Transcript_5518:138-2000(+)|eukprot:CAMPEP_0117442176 /NCGR_PEP_ID=MMETSP0759-20121206/4015_1 /TAXON_ID=63605 /ORGANISM="Percolomonas cosmopolitus, Strain WS" /LENGTH=620 /DNA_ID=CAMNT_0005234053 /DNA_START=117 /DNA_END=1979 /DNA_ORIENTATION=-
MVYIENGILKQGSKLFTKGGFNRPEAQLRHKLSNRPDATYKFSLHDESTWNRYHVYLCRACPWAHRVRIALKMLNLEQKISFSYVEDKKPESTGWKLAGLDPAGTGKSYLYEIYQQTPNYSGVITTPALYDKQHKQVINNESADIIRMLNECVGGDWYPEKLRKEIDEVNERVYPTLNNGVYKTGSSTSQESYSKLVTELFDTLEWLEGILKKQRYLVSNTQITEADWRLFTTLIRFDTVYFTLFKCSKKKIEDYHNLSNYLRELYALVEDTVHFDSYRGHYYDGFPHLNPSKIIPRGGAPEHLNLPHDRDRFAYDASHFKQRDVKGAFKRSESEFREQISEDGDYPPAKDRYHLYIADNCPWCHRVMVARALLGLEKVISVDKVYPIRDGDQGWAFKPEKSSYEGEYTADTVCKKTHIPEIYKMLGKTGKTVPILFDKKRMEIVNNESSEIIRMMNQKLRRFGHEKVDLYPMSQRDEIDELNEYIYEALNNGAYMAGFAKSQEAYNLAYEKYFDALEALNGIFRVRKFLTGDHVTEADVRLFPTIFRHDHVYHGRFLLNKKFVKDLKYVREWLDRMLELPGVADNSSIEHSKLGYFSNHGNGVVPLGPEWKVGGTLEKE